MPLFRKVRKNGKEIELPASGAELRSEMGKIAGEERFKRFKAQGDDLLESNSSILSRAVFDSLGITWDEAKRAIDPNVWSRSVGNLFTNTDTKPLFPIITEDYIRNGYDKAGRASELIMGTVTMEQLSQEFYYYEDSTEDKDSELDFRLIGQGAPIPVMTIGIQDKKTVRVYKRGGGVEIADEAKAMKIDQLAAFLQRRGQRLGRTDEALAINTLLNGYFDDGWDAPNTIGVKNVGTIDIVDMWYSLQYANDKYGYTPNRVIMNLKTSEEWVSSVTQAGNPLFLQDLMKGSMPDVINSKPFVTPRMADGQVMFVDTNFALQEYLFKALTTETNRDVKTQVEGSYTTKTGDYVTFEKNARLLVDLTQTR